MWTRITPHWRWQTLRLEATLRSTDTLSTSSRLMNTPRNTSTNTWIESARSERAETAPPLLRVNKNNIARDLLHNEKHSTRTIRADNCFLCNYKPAWMKKEQGEVVRGARSGCDTTACENQLQKALNRCQSTRAWKRIQRLTPPSSALKSFSWSIDEKQDGWSALYTLAALSLCSR